MAEVKQQQLVNDENQTTTNINGNEQEVQNVQQEEVKNAEQPKEEAKKETKPQKKKQSSNNQKKEQIITLSKFINLIKFEQPQTIKVELQKVKKYNKPAIWEAGGTNKNYGYSILVATNSFLPKFPIVYNKNNPKKSNRGLMYVMIGDHIGICFYQSKKNFDFTCKCSVYKVIKIEKINDAFVATLNKVLDNNYIYVDQQQQDNINLSLFISRLINVATNKPKKVPLWSIPWEIFKSKLNYWLEIEPAEVDKKNVIRINDIEELYSRLKKKYSRNDRLLLTVHKYIIDEKNNKVKLQIQPIENNIHDLFLNDDALRKSNPTEEDIERVFQKLQQILVFADELFELEITDGNYIFVRDWFLVFRKKNVKDLINYLKRSIDSEDSNERSLLRVFKF